MPNNAGVKPSAGGIVSDASGAKPGREFRGQEAKPLTPINVRPMLDELGNPIYRKIERRIEEQPDIVAGALSASRSPEQAFRKLFGTWGHHPEMEAKAIAAVIRNGLLSVHGLLTSLLVQQENGIPLVPTAVQLQLLEFLNSSGDATIRSAVANLRNDSQNGYRSVEPYQQLIETMFGYNIEFGANLTDPEAQFRQLERLADSNLLIVYYLNSIGVTRPGFSGRDAFQQYFASTAEGGQVTVYLGADDNVSSASDSAYRGFVPLPSSTNADNVDALGSIYLGSQTLTATITHEFFHQLDRRLGGNVNASSGTSSTVMGLDTYLLTVAVNSTYNITGIPNTGSQLGSRANPSETDTPELFADYGMTAVHERYSSTRDELAQTSETSDPNNTFVQFDRNDTGQLRPSSRDIECALKQYFQQVIAGISPEQMVFDPEQCDDQRNRGTES